MNSYKDKMKRQGNKSREFDINEVDSFIKSLEEKIEILIDKTGQLPNVDKKGNSECPFAEELYAYKEKAVKLVQNAIKELHKYITIVEEEIGRCSRNIDQVSSDKKKLQTEETKEQYERTLEFAISEYKGVVHRLKRLNELLEKAEEEIQKAMEKKWPLGEPKERDHFNPEAVLNDITNAHKLGVSYTDYNSNRQGPSFQREINSLISIGPID